MFLLNRRHNAAPVRRYQGYDPSPIASSNLLPALLSLINLKPLLYEPHPYALLHSISAGKCLFFKAFQQLRVEIMQAVVQAPVKPIHSPFKPPFGKPHQVLAIRCID